MPRSVGASLLAVLNFFGCPYYVSLSLSGQLDLPKEYRAFALYCVVVLLFHFYLLSTLSLPSLNAQLLRVASTDPATVCPSDTLFIIIIFIIIIYFKHFVGLRVPIGAFPSQTRRTAITTRKRFHPLPYEQEKEEENLKRESACISKKVWKSTQSLAWQPPLTASTQTEREPAVAQCYSEAKRPLPLPPHLTALIRIVFSDFILLLALGSSKAGVGNICKKERKTTTTTTKKDNNNNNKKKTTIEFYYCDHIPKTLTHTPKEGKPKYKLGLPSIRRPLTNQQKKKPNYHQQLFHYFYLRTLPLSFLDLHTAMQHQHAFSPFSTSPHSQLGSGVQQPFGPPRTQQPFAAAATSWSSRPQRKDPTIGAAERMDSEPSRGGFTVQADTASFASGHFVSGASSSSEGLEHYTAQHRSPLTDAPPYAAPIAHRDKRLHHDFKALTKAERQRVVQREAADSDLLARTVHLRFLPTGMKQGELARLCSECGPYLRVRICGNSNNNQNWIYGFVEFETREGAFNLMQLNGRELPNGEGRPVLRLKCHTANQPIVDRVFHDADPASRSPCIFGQGSFENRTLKDALDSYFNLKAKEMLQQQGAGVGGPRQSGSAFGMGDETPSGSSGAGADGSGQHSCADLATSSQLRASAQAFVPPGAGGAFTVTADDRDEYSVSNPPTPQMPGLKLRHASALPAYVLPPPCAPPALDAAAYGVVSPQPHPQRRTMPAGLCAEEVEAALSRTLESMIGSELALNGEEVVQLCLTLLHRAVQQGSAYMQSSQHFYETAGTLERLLEKLDTHEGLTGRAADTASRDYASELPQKVTQLRLLGNLLLLLLHLARRSIRDALPFTYALIRCVMEVPLELLAPPGAPAPPTGGLPFAAGPLDREPLEMASGVVSGEAKLLETVLRDDEEDEADQRLVSAMEDELGSPLAETSPLGMSERQLFYLRDVNFNRYVLNALLCAGIAMEEVMPSVAAQIYATTLNRAEKVLGVSSDVVQRCSEGISAVAGGPTPFSAPDSAAANRRQYPRLGDEVMGHAASPSDPPRDVTAFPRYFFESAAAVLAQVREDELQMWASLPPMHLMHFF
eukprot:gene3620-2557_t